MGRNVIDYVNDVLDSVDRHMASGNFSGLCDEVKRQTSDFADGARDFWNSTYNAGHTNNPYAANNYRNRYQNGTRRGPYGGTQGGAYGGQRGGAQGTYGGTSGQGGQGDSYVPYGARQQMPYGAGGGSHSANGRNQTYSNAQGPSRPYQGGHMEKPAYARGAGSALPRQNEWLKEDDYFRAPEGRAAAIAQSIFGVGMAVIFGIGALISIIFGLVGTGSIPLMVILSIITALFGVLGGMGIRKGRLIKNFITFRKTLKKSKFATVDDLGTAAGLDRNKTVAELKELVKEGAFKQGHFDEKETTFIATDELYTQYLNAERGAAEARRVEAEKAKAEGALPEEVKQLLDRGNEYISEIRQANDAIPDALITGKLNRMEEIVSKIFEEVRRRPELAGKLNMFMDYYLPTTTKLLGAYEELDRHTLAGENISTAKREIAGSLDTINDAFEKLLDSFFADQAMDVSADISVMKTMMQQDGLTPDEMEAYRRRMARQEAQMEHSETLSALQAEMDGIDGEMAAGPGLTPGMGDDLGDTFVAPDEGEGEGIVLKF